MRIAPPPGKLTMRSLPAAVKFPVVRPMALAIAVAIGPIGVFFAASSGPVTAAVADGSSVALVAR
jgi:hypothetical protein